MTSADRRQVQSLYRMLTEHQLAELRAAFLADRQTAVRQGRMMTTIAFCDGRIACIDAELARRRRQAAP